MQDRNIGRLLLTLQLILLCQIWWHLEICHAEAFPAFPLRVADFARGTSKNKFNSICNHPLHPWMCTSSLGKSLNGNQRLIVAENNQSQISFRTPKSVTPSTLVVTLPPHYLTRTETSDFNSLPLQVLPPNYSYEVDPNYDMCSHPFHAWLCDRSTQRNRSDKLPKATMSGGQSQKPVVPTTIKPSNTQISIEFVSHPLQEKDSKEVAKNFSHFSNQLLGNNFKIQKSASSPATSVTHNSCNHPFHSWLCYYNAKAESKVRLNVITTHSTQKDPKPILPRQDQVIHPIKQSKAEKSGSSRCSHAFHSWICHSSATVPVASPVAKTLIADTQIVHPHKVPNETHPFLKPIIHNCNHAFHSWLCPKTSQKVHVKSISTTTLKPKLSKSFLSNGSDNLVTKKPPPREFPAAMSDIDKCSHAFHSWLCPKSIQPNQTKAFITAKPSNQGRNLIIKISKKMPPAQQPQKIITHKPLVLPSSNHCSHAFHSWLCPQSKPIEPKSPTFTTPPPRLSKNLHPHSSKANDSQKCNHAFHSWLCASPKQRTTPKPSTTTTTQTTTTTTTTTTVTTTPVSKKGKSIISNSLINIATQAPPPMKTTTSSTNDYHQCNHAFHSWLCATPKRNATTPIPKFENSLIPLNTLNAPVTPPNAPPPLNSSNNKFNHAFHSWLCQEPSTTRNIVSGEVKQNNSSKQSQQVSILSHTKSISDAPHLKKEFDCNDPNAINNPLFSPRCQINKTIPTSTSTKRTSTTTEKKVFNGKSFDSAVANNFFQISTAPTTTVRIPQSNSWEGKNPCTHAFHAWLCQPLRPKLTQPPFSPPRHSPNFVLNHLKKSGKTLIPTLRPAASLASTVKSEKLESRNIPSINTNHEKKHDGDQCSHAFHSFLCNKPNPKITTSSVFFKPTTELPIRNSFFESRSSDIQIVSKTDDPCSHPFHSWLCFTFDNRKSTLSLDQIPNVMSLPLENENIKMIVEVSPRNTRRIKTSDQNVLINHENFDDAVVKPLDEDTILVSEDDIVSGDELLNKLDFKSDSFFDIDESESPPQPNYRNTAVPAITVKPTLTRSPGTSIVNETNKNINSSRRKKELDGSLPTVPTTVIRILPEYDDWSDPMEFESKRTIPRKKNK